MSRKATAATAAQRTVSIIGLGNWGSSLAHALLRAGVSLHEVIVSRRSQHTAANAKWARGLRITTLENATLEAGILWLCVSDADIETITSSLLQRAASLRLDLKKCLVVHSSGALGRDVLAPAAHAGAATASAHPVMSFPTRKPVALQGTPFGVEADVSGRRVLYPMIRRMGGQPFNIAPGHKALYHAIGMLSSPLLVTHLVAAQQTAELAGFGSREARALIEPIVRATLDNVFRQGAKRSFSGPIARGDAETIRLHLQALEPHPMLAGLYRSLALFALDSLPSLRTAELRRVLGPK